jgi:hypothetical protein
MDHLFQSHTQRQLTHNTYIHKFIRTYYIHTYMHTYTHETTHPSELGHVLLDSGPPSSYKTVPVSRSHTLHERSHEPVATYVLSTTSSLSSSYSERTLIARQRTLRVYVCVCVCKRVWTWCEIASAVNCYGQIKDHVCVCLRVYVCVCVNACEHGVKSYLQWTVMAR